MAQKKKSTANKSGAKTTNKKKSNVSTIKPVRREVGSIVCLFLGLFSFIGYFNVDAWFITWFCGFIKGIIGWGYYIFPFALLIASFILGFHRGRPVVLRLISALVLPLILGSLSHLLFCKQELEFTGELIKLLYTGGKDMLSGGVLGGVISMGLEGMFSVYGALPLLIVGFIYFAMTSVNVTVRKIVDYFNSRPKLEYEPEPEHIESPVKEARQPGRKRRAIDIPLDEEAPVPVDDIPEEKVGFFNKRPRVRTPDEVFQSTPIPKQSPTEASFVPPLPTVQEISSELTELEKTAPKLKSSEVAAETASIASEIESSLPEDTDSYEMPPMELLRKGTVSAVDGREEIALNRERLDSTIRSFGVNAAITNVTRGPTVTRYDLELEQGVKLTKLTNLAGDLALSLGVSGVRIAPIPNKVSTVGVEVPNKLVSMVYLRDIIEASSFKDAASKLTFSIGKDIAGNCIVGNIAKLPHLLIAGTTGSGKSVCMNSLILSLLYKATPDEVRLIMIDPKMVELGIYNGIPHLFIPVVTDPKKAAGALQWAVVEMLKRYRLFSEAGVRDLTGYNSQMKSNGGQTMPQVVIVIDELADLMLVASKEVEESICRVAQMGRASGMHLVIATQRPSADVITGLMKANIPSRIAFAVSSAMESRIILDSQGAEKLVGSGDMLYAPLGSGKPKRIQGAFVSDEEREEVVSFVKQNADAQYSDEIIEQIEKAAEEKGSTGAKSDEPAAPAKDYDELLPQAVDVIFETKQASVSMLQRRLKLGYSRAARLVDQLEELGVVGPFEGSKPRQIVISKQQWQEMQMISGTAPIEQLQGEYSFSDFEDIPEEEWE